MGRQFTDVPCRFGAPMGRSSFNNAPVQEGAPRRVHVFRVRFVSYDYDDGGAYWGGGSALYCARDKDGDVQLFTRSKTRNAAITWLREQHPNLRPIKA
jgi:hypothetical protein